MSTCVGVFVLVPLSPCLILGWGPFPRLSGAGGAFAVVAYYLAGGVALAVYLWSGRSVVRLRLNGTGFRWSLFYEIFRVGVVAALITVGTNLTVAIATGFVGRFGAGAIGGLWHRAIQDLVACQIQMVISDLVAVLPQVRAGTIKAYGVTTKTRLLSAPDIATLDEAGLPGFNISLWHGLWPPKGTPRNIIAKLNGAVTDALADPTVRARPADVAQEIFPRHRQPLEALGAFQRG